MVSIYFQKYFIIWNLLLNLSRDQRFQKKNKINNPYAFLGAVPLAITNQSSTLLTARYKLTWGTLEPKACIRLLV